MTPGIRELRPRLDALEPRVMLASDAEWVGPSQPGIGQPALLTTEAANLREIHELTGVAYAQAQGLQGAGQTVVIIDSGIAYDHLALGGGLGPEYRVVGGWDFTEENDADPYDDGPAGFHGTHVAGIVGSSDPQHLGVAPKVDLVAVRVFNDQGRGKLSWLESSLQWVIDHLDAFEHPITTVNLSIGTDWNDLSLPDYADLEDEFEVLRAQGVFVVAAAGNRFDPDHPGLSYPAISTNVVAASSWDAKNRLSDFSQRDRSAFLLPGENIASTVPDYLADFNGITDDFYAASGTSMAAPYLAGASVLVREAMQQVGTEHVSVEAIEALLRATAHEVFDPVTGGTYAAIDLKAAVQRILGTPPEVLVDQEGTTLRVRGTHDIDTIQFDDAGFVSVNGARFSIAAGQLQQILIEGDGRDRIQIFTASDHVQIQLQPQSAHLTTPSYAIRAEGLAEIKVFATGTDIDAEFRGGKGLDQFVAKPTHSWMQGSGYLNYVRGVTQVTAFADDTTDTALLYDSPTADVLQTWPGTAILAAPQHTATARGFATVGVRAYAGGNDQATLHGSAGDDTAKTTPRYTSLQADSYFVYVEGIHDTLVLSEGGVDAAQLWDSDGHDEVELGVDRQRILSAANHTELQGFTNVQAYAGGGQDSVTFVGTAGPEAFHAKPTHGWMTAGAALYYARGFDEIVIQGHGGDDLARLYDAATSDHFVLGPGYASAHGPSFAYAVHDVPRIHAISQQGSDRAELMDSRLRDRLYATEAGIWITGTDYLNSLVGFHRVETASSGGDDCLVLANALASLAVRDHDTWLLDELDVELVAQGFACVDG